MYWHHSNVSLQLEKYTYRIILPNNIYFQEDIVLSDTIFPSDG